MARPLRYYRPGVLIETTSRTIHGRKLLRPEPRINELILGILGRALFLYPVSLHAVAVLSNHIHMLLSSLYGNSIADFMEFVNGNIAREVGRHIGWRDKFWARRYRSIDVIDEPAEAARLRYLLAQGCKEGLVDHPARWPGVHSAAALCHGRPLEGVWVDRTGLYQARRRKATADATEDDFSTIYPVPLTPLPSCAEVSDADYQHLCRDLVADIAKQAADERAHTGRAPLGVDAILAADPFAIPDATDHSPAPAVHYTAPRRRDQWMQMRRQFANDFYRQSLRLRRGEPDVSFPPGSFPPHGPFVPFIPEPDLPVPTIDTG